MNKTQLAIMELRAIQNWRTRAQAYYESFVGEKTNAEHRTMVHGPEGGFLGQNSGERIREPEMVSGTPES